MVDVLLASASQRRAAMLEERGFTIIQKPLRARERPHRHGLSVSEQVANTLEGKIESALRELSEPLIVVADTLVEDPDDPLQPLGQPKDRHEALSMLLRLSGRNHRVWTGTALIENGTTMSWSGYSTVAIDVLDDEVLEALIVSGSWRGKAGGYDFAGAMAQFASIVEGSEETVLGLVPDIFQALQSRC